MMAIAAIVCSNGRMRICVCGLSDELMNELEAAALDRVHNSRRPLDRLFALCDPVT